MKNAKEMEVFRYMAKITNTNTTKKNDEEINQIPATNNKKSKRIGVAKKEMEGFDVSLEEFNNIEIPDFGL